MENVAQVLDNNLVEFPKDLLRHYSFHQHGRRDARCNPFVIGNPIVSSMTSFNTNNYNIPQIPGDDIAKKWNQRQFNGKKKKRRRKFSQIFAKL